MFPCLDVMLGSRVSSQRCKTSAMMNCPGFAVLSCSQRYVPFCSYIRSFVHKLFFTCSELHCEVYWSVCYYVGSYASITSVHCHKRIWVPYYSTNCIGASRIPILWELLYIKIELRVFTLLFFTSHHFILLFLACCSWIALSSTVSLSLSLWFHLVCTLCWGVTWQQQRRLPLFHYLQC
jgi:hypothetical protein